jgi:hypothetical protein
MKTLREYGSAASYSTSAGTSAPAARAQVQQGAQALVLGGQLLGAGGALGSGAPARRAALRGPGRRLQALQVAQAVVPAAPPAPAASRCSGSSAVASAARIGW